MMGRKSRAKTPPTSDTPPAQGMMFQKQRSRGTTFGARPDGTWGPIGPPPEEDATAEDATAEDDNEPDNERGEDDEE